MPNWRIMLVDDEEDLLNLMEQVITTKYEVVKAYNGLDALEKLDRYQPDFIILDVMMPVMDGFATCEALRKNPAYRQIPIYFLTSSSDREDIKKGYDLGCNLYLRKPFDPFRLLKNIDFYIEQNKLSPKEKKYTLKELRELDEKQMVKEAPVQKEEKRPVRVMIIDDNQETLDFISFALKKQQEIPWKFEPIVTTQPVDALSNIVHYQPDIIVLDIRMPKLDGFQLCKIIQVNKNLKDTRILFISGIATPKDKEYAFRLTGNPLLRKPFEMKDITSALVDICEKPEFRIKEKRMSYEKIQSEMKREKQEVEEEFRKRKHKEVREEQMKEFTKFYKEVEKDQGGERESR